MKTKKDLLIAARATGEKLVGKTDQFDITSGLVSDFAQSDAPKACFDEFSRIAIETKGEYEKLATVDLTPPPAV